MNEPKRFTCHPVKGTSLFVKMVETDLFDSKCDPSTCPFPGLSGQERTKQVVDIIFPTLNSVTSSYNFVVVLFLLVFIHAYCYDHIVFLFYFVLVLISVSFVLLFLPTQCLHNPRLFKSLKHLIRGYKIMLKRATSHWKIPHGVI